VSRDLVTRSVLIALHHEGNPARRAFALDDPEGYALDRRTEILGELLGMVEAWRAAGSPRSDAKSRFNKKGWGPIVGGILAVAGFPDFLGNAERAAMELDDSKCEFAALVAVLAARPAEVWTAAELAALAGERGLFPGAPGESPRARATRVGILCGRYVDERFDLADDRSAVFRKAEKRKGNEYSVELEVPDRD
jgi:hypothetical protein